MPAQVAPSGGAPVRNANFTFQQPPQAAAAAGGYRDPFTGKQKSGSSVANSRNNLMNDRRVVRGNTYASQVVPISAQA